MSPVERPSAPRPADAPDPVFSFRWSWWRRPASMRWVGDGFDGHMAIAIWTWLRSRAVGAGIGLIVAAAMMLAAGVALFLSVSFVVIGARLLSERWRWWSVLGLACAVAGALAWLDARSDPVVRPHPSLLLVHAAIVGQMTRRPWAAVAVAAVPPALAAIAELGSGGFQNRWTLAAAALFSVVSLPPRVVGFFIAAAFGGAIVQAARADLTLLVATVSAMVLVFPATAILRAANEPCRGADPTTRWVAAGHRRPGMAAAAYAGLGFAMAMAVYSPFHAPWLPGVVFAVSAWTASHVVAGSRGFVGRLAAIVASGPVAGTLVMAIVVYSARQDDPWMLAASFVGAALFGASVGALPWHLPVRRPGALLLAALSVGCAGVICTWLELDAAGWAWVQASADGYVSSRIAAAALAGAWIVVCLAVARTARSRTTVPDDHPVHQLRQLREGRAEGA